MREAIYSGPKRSGICVCGHSWEAHHLGMVMKPGAEVTDGGVEYYIPQECEYYGCNEMSGVDTEGDEHCFGYRDNMKEEKCKP